MLSLEYISEKMWIVSLFSFLDWLSRPINRIKKQFKKNYRFRKLFKKNMYLLAMSLFLL
jgi:hypothetical protein